MHGMHSRHLCGRSGLEMHQLFGRNLLDDYCSYQLECLCLMRSCQVLGQRRHRLLCLSRRLILRDLGLKWNFLLGGLLFSCLSDCMH